MPLERLPNPLYPIGCALSHGLSRHLMRIGIKNILSYLQKIKTPTFFNRYGVVISHSTPSSRIIDGMELIQLPI